MLDYKVEYLKTQIRASGLFGYKKRPSGEDTAKKLETLLAEHVRMGYEVVNIAPINSFEVYGGSFSTTQTDGLMITFKKKI